MTSPSSGTAEVCRAPGMPAEFVMRLAARTRSAAGWRRAGIAAALGALAVGALPPFNLVFLLLPAFTGLVWLIEGTPTRWAAFRLGWCWGLGFFVFGLYWTTLSLFVDIERFWWLVPFALFGLPILLAVYAGAAVAATRAIPGSTVSRALVLAIAWTGAEWLRGHLLTGFPWNLIGYAWSADAPPLLAVLQSTALFGSYGLSLITVAVAALPAGLGGSPIYGSPTYSSPGASRWRRAGPAVIGGVVLVGIGVFGAVRLSAGPDPLVPGVTLRLVQPNIPETLKWDPAARARNFQAILALAAAPAATPPTDIVLPEAAITYLLNRDGGARGALAAVTPPGGLMLAGTIRGNPLPAPPTEFFDSLMALDGSGAVIATYDKFHLVPFGEYVPLARYLPLERIVGGLGALSSGPGPVTLALPHLPPVSPLICYEANFPEDVVAPGPRPAWLLTITNDAWFGTSTGPYQHFASARVRAVEQGLPLLRAANTGISGVVDAHGRVLQRLGLNRAGVIDTALPMPLGITPYGQYGDFALLVMMLLTGWVAWGCRKYR
ncbi:MAG TPA: apolipoprotein N-acyltransferase [Stellaceae bacterium]|nr:apolipoprotein N-acyltransferase [Stellaceae bacterium]